MEKLERRIKTKDFFIAGSLQDPALKGKGIKTHKIPIWFIFLDQPFLSAALDLSLLSQCNHTIMSHGTYSFWAGFLAGQGKGLRILPPFFDKYRTGGQTSSHFNVPPFESKLPKFYYGMKFFRWYIILWFNRWMDMFLASKWKSSDSVSCNDGIEPSLPSSSCQNSLHPSCLKSCPMFFFTEAIVKAYVGHPWVLKGSGCWVSSWGFYHWKICKFR